VELYWHNYFWPIIDDWYLLDFKNLTITTIASMPDLVPSIPFINPMHPCENQLIVFNVLGQNLGPTATSAFAVDVFIDGQPFDSIWVNGCGAFSGFRVQSKAWPTTSGLHSVCFVLDSANIVSESNETNNELTLQFQVSDVTPPRITIVSPQNTTYIDLVPLTFTIDELSFWTGYSLDNQANVTIFGNTTLARLYEGRHSLIVCANDTSGNMGTSCEVAFTIYLSTNPVASFNFTPPIQKVGEPIIFASISIPGWNGTQYVPVTEYCWNFGDGNITTVSEPVVSHVYSSVGNYVVSLNVTTSYGLWNSTSSSIKVTYETDMNKDGGINIVDVTIIAAAYGSKPGHSKWNDNADLDGNGWINIIDITIVAKDYGKTV
jgi:hypothetical protein